MTSHSALQLVALTLAYYGSDGNLHDKVPDEIWDHCYANGWTKNSTFGVPGDDPVTVITAEGLLALRGMLSTLAADLKAESSPFPAPALEPFERSLYPEDSWPARWPWWAPLAVSALVAFVLIALVVLL